MNTFMATVAVIGAIVVVGMLISGWRAMGEAGVFRRAGEDRKASHRILVVAVVVVLFVWAYHSGKEADLQSRLDGQARLAESLQSRSRADCAELVNNYLNEITALQVLAGRLYAASPPNTLGLDNSPIAASLFLMTHYPAGFDSEKYRDLATGTTIDPTVEDAMTGCGLKHVIEADPRQGSHGRVVPIPGDTTTAGDIADGDAPIESTPSVFAPHEVVNPAKPDKQAQTDLRNALVAAKTCYADAHTYTGCDQPTLEGIEPSLSFTTADEGSSGPGVVSTNVPEGSRWFDLAAWSKSGTCFYVHEDATAKTSYGSATTASGAACSATDANSATKASWPVSRTP